MTPDTLDRVRYPMTVVIPTLGGPALRQTIAALNGGSVVPERILVCIPRQEASRLENLREPNIEILVTDCRGQVAQRTCGFRNASHEVVMQLDDDMFVDWDCIVELLKTLEAAGPRAAVAPSLVDVATGLSIYRQPARNRAVETLYYWLMNGKAGYQEGCIEKSGSAVGVDPRRDNRDRYEVEWLAGGCVMHYRESLVLEDFYPFTGKAYCEDIIHSHHLKTRGIRLLVEPKAVCRLEVESPFDASPRKFARELVLDLRARRYYMRLSSRRSLRMYLFYLISCISYVLKKLGTLGAAGRRRRAS